MMAMIRAAVAAALFGALGTPAFPAPVISGCRVFADNNVWNLPVDTLPVDSNSADYIETIGATSGVHPDFGSGLWDGGPIGIPYVEVPGTQAAVPVVFEYADESDPGPYPIPVTAPIEGGSQSTGDRHVLVLDTGHCTLYELYRAYRQADDSWHAGSGAVFNLTSNALRPATWTSADAAGLPILPGLVRYSEVAAGSIDHALRFTAPATRNAFIWPARHDASELTALAYPPMGQRFRLKAGFNIAGFPPQVQVILRALKKYGMILADNGAAWFISGVPDARWNNTVLRRLSGVSGAAFEAVDESGLMVDVDSAQASLAGSINLNATPPAEPTRLIFIHHSTGENLLADGNGALGTALRKNGYFVSDTNYGWGPDSIGDATDIGHWWQWFRGPTSTTYLNALYAEGEQHSSYSRLPAAPSGENAIVVFKSCFPNSALQGDPADPVPPIDSNPLKGQDSGSPAHTVANAKGIYLSLLDYFRTRQDKLFIALTAPPLSDAANAANARAFNQWLVTDWLKDYPYRNVAVFDFYNVLTTNGGTSGVNDLNRATGNHHRLYTGILQHKTDGDNDASPNTLEYRSGDDHPSRAGNLKATAEFMPLLNLFYHCWHGTGGCPTSAPSNLLAHATSSATIALSWQDNSLDEAGFVIERKPGGCAVGGTWARIATAPGNAVSFDSAGLSATTTYAYRIAAYNAKGSSAASDCAAATTGVTTIPIAPTGLVATATGAATVTLRWSDGSTNETGFRLYRKAGTGAWQILGAVNANLTTYTDRKATGNATSVSTSYYLSACNSAGCAPSAAQATVPHAPTTLTALPDGAGRIRLGWADRSSNETGFIIEQKAGKCAATGAWTQVGSVDAGVMSFIATGLTAARSYAYRTRALARSADQPYADGYSLYTNCAAATAL